MLCWAPPPPGWNGHHGGRPIPEKVGRKLGSAAADAVAELDRLDRGDPRTVQQHLRRADQLLEQLRCDSEAHRSRLTPNGFAQRLRQLGDRIVKASETPTKAAVADCDKFLAKVAEHRSAGSGERRDEASAAEMAVRLVRWLARPAEAPESFPNSAAAYMLDGSFVDRAREPLSRGAEADGLAEAFSLLERKVSELRAGMNESFAEGAARWCADASGRTADVLGGEDVLSEVVARVVAGGKPNPTRRARRDELGGVPRTSERRTKGPLVRGDADRIGDSAAAGHRRRPRARPPTPA